MFEGCQAMYEMVSNKLNYHLMSHILQRNNLSPFSEVICSNQEENVVALMMGDGLMIEA
jgi:hypothetical protein